MKKYLALFTIFFTCLMACENKAGIHKDPSQVPGKDSIEVKVSVVPQKQAGPAFLADDKDYKNRIVEKKGRFYLSGDAWNDSVGVVGRSIAVKIGK